MPQNLVQMQENELWNIAKAELSKNIASEVFAAWFDKMEFVEGSEEEVVLGIEGEFAAMWVTDNYLDILKRHLSLAAGRNISVRLIAIENETQEVEDAIQSKQIERALGPKPKVKVEAPAIDSRNTFENFVVGDSNQFAHAAALAVAKSPGSAYNPLLLYGAAGTGKTHLMHSIAHFIFQANPSAHIVYLSSERFVNEYLTALSDKEISKFRQRYRNVDVLLIDDIQFFSGKESCQNEFFHTFNDLFMLQKQIVLSCDKPINEVPKLEQRLVSRFEWGIAVDIQSPDYETRLAILNRKASALGAKIDPSIIDMIARRITKNVRRLEGALNKVVGYMNLVEHLDLDAAQKLLSGAFINDDENQVGIDLIQKKVSEMYRIDPSEMTGRRRPANIALARQIAMYISRKLTTHSLEEIGQRFGGRDHGTVMYAIKAVEDSMETDENLKRGVEYLLKILSF